MQDSAEINVRVVAVEHELLRARCARGWLNVCQTMAPKKITGFGPDASPLFEAFLLVSHDHDAGCVLIAAFQHGELRAVRESYQVFWTNQIDFSAGRCNLLRALFEKVV